MPAKYTSFNSVLSKAYAIILIAVTVFFGVLCYWIWKDVEEELYTELAHKVSVLERYYNLSFHQRELGLLSIGHRMLDIKGEDSTRQRTEVARNALRLYDEFLAIGLADTTGQLIAFTGEVEGKNLPNLVTSIESKRSFLLTKEAQGLVIGEAYYFDKVQDWIIPIRVPIRDTQGNLVAVNTSAIQCEMLNTNLQGFGFDPRYRVHLINHIFGITQLYFPLHRENYDSLLGKPAQIYSEVVNSGKIGQYDKLEGFNNFESRHILGVRTNPDILDHYLIVSVDKSLLWLAFWESLSIILVIYVFLMSLAGISYTYFRRQELLYWQKLNAEREYSTKLIRNTPALIIGVTNQGICRFINPAAEQVTGFTKEEIIGKNWWKTCYRGEDFQQVKVLLEKMKTQKIEDYEMILTRKDGNKRIISWNAMFLYNNKGDLAEGIGFGTDITVLKNTEQELKRYTQNLESLVKERTDELQSANKDLKFSNRKLRLQREKLERTLEDLRNTQHQLVQSEKMASLGMLSAGIGHEINNPLNFIKGGITGLYKHLSKTRAFDSKTDRFFEAVHEGVSRASQIVSSLSHFSRQGSTMDECCNIHSIIDNCLVMLQNRTKNKVEIIKNYADAPLEIRGNEGKLHQVFLNMLSNAEQAIETTGNIMIRTFYNHDTIQVHIQDSGVGMDEEQISLIQDPFFTTKAPGQGTGLGLSISYSIVEEHCGNIEVKSKPGQGSTFMISFPCN